MVKSSTLNFNDLQLLHTKLGDMKSLTSQYQSNTSVYESVIADAITVLSHCIWRVFY